jgi:hypothetical protein
MQAAEINLEVVGPVAEIAAAMRASFASVCDALVALRDAGKHVPDLARHLLGCSFTEAGVELGPDAFDLFRVEVVDEAALRTDKISVRVDPNDRYLELVSAISGDVDSRFDLHFDHGWPILSVGGVAAPTVAEGRDESIVPAGCLCTPCTLAEHER